MARIPEAEIERLKKEAPIERLVMRFGVELKRQGAGLGAGARSIRWREAVIAVAPLDAVLPTLRRVDPGV
ncbi:MAG: hypothetical protein IT169_02315 [Bryobacterales bacterium]|nr:hypothetical protein [Bryobacterales bacterium]